MQHTQGCIGPLCSYTARVKIQTIHGEIEAAELVKREFVENGHRITEYYLGDELVHRSVTTDLAPVVAGADAASFL